MFVDIIGKCYVSIFNKTGGKCCNNIKVTNSFSVKGRVRKVEMLSFK